MIKYDEDLNQIPSKSRVYAIHGQDAFNTFEFIVTVKEGHIDLLIKGDEDERLLIPLRYGIFSKLAEFLWAIEQAEGHAVEGSPAMMKARDYWIGEIP